MRTGLLRAAGPNRGQFSRNAPHPKVAMLVVSIVLEAAVAVIATIIALLAVWGSSAVTFQIGAHGQEPA
jgi:hypothetical protein